MELSRLWRAALVKPGSKLEEEEEEDGISSEHTKDSGGDDTMTEDSAAMAKHRFEMQTNELRGAEKKTCKRAAAAMRVDEVLEARLKEKENRHSESQFSGLRLTLSSLYDL
nr:hypothetical protein Iba_chr15aCG13090 [Ipomoea batatas]